MSDIIDMEARIKDYISANIDKINSKLDSMGNAAKASTAKASGGFLSMGASIDKLVKTAAGLWIFRQISGYLSDATNELKKQTDADAKLAAVIRSTGMAAGFTTEQLQEVANGLQSVTTHGNETIENLQAVLLGFQNIKGDNFIRTTEAVIDMAAVMGTDLVSAAQALGKAIDSPTQGMSSLSRQGFVWTKQEKELVAQLEESGKLYEAQEIILKSVESAFGGVARAMAETDVGKLEQTNNIIGDMSEKLGKDLLPLMREWKELQLSIATLAIPAGTVILKGLNAEIQMIKGVSRELLQTNETISVAQGENEKEGINRLIKHIETLKNKYKEQQAVVESAQKNLDNMPGGAGIISVKMAEKGLADANKKFAEYEELIYKTQQALGKMTGTRTTSSAGGGATSAKKELTEDELQIRIEQLQEQIQYETELQKEIEALEKEMNSSYPLYGMTDKALGPQAAKEIYDIGEPGKEDEAIQKKSLEFSTQLHDAKLALQQAEILAKADKSTQELEILKIQQEEELKIYEEGSTARFLVEQRHKLELDTLDKKTQKDKQDRDKQTEQKKYATMQATTDYTIGSLQTIATAVKSTSGVQKTLDIAQATANVYIGVTKAIASGQLWKVGLIVATGMAQVANISKLKYAQSGIVPGNSTVGDRQMAMVNSREMILNSRDQAALFDLIKRPNSVDNSSQVSLNINLGTDAQYDMRAARYTVDQLAPIIGEVLLKAKTEGRLRQYEGAR
jgi:hypothetical protein